MTGIKFPCEVEIGRYSVIDHFGGVVISRYARIGDNCRIWSGLLVGLQSAGKPCAPVISNNLDIEAGAKAPGPIRIGDNVIIGDNAVVLCDVPANYITVGVPAVVKPGRPSDA